MPGILPDYLDAPSLPAAHGFSFGNAPATGNDGNAWARRLLLDAARAEAFRHQLAMLSIEAQRRLALHPSQRSGDQSGTAANSTNTPKEPPATPEATLASSSMSRSSSTA